MLEEPEIKLHSTIHNLFSPHLPVFRYPDNFSAVDILYFNSVRIC
jgi:hypothetical protein